MKLLTLLFVSLSAFFSSFAQTASADPNIAVPGPLQLLPLILLSSDQKLVQEKRKKQKPLLIYYTAMMEFILPGIVMSGVKTVLLLN